jgi:hypothetical protein
MIIVEDSKPAPHGTAAGNLEKPSSSTYTTQQFRSYYSEKHFLLANLSHM